MFRCRMNDDCAILRWIALFPGSGIEKQALLNALRRGESMIAPLINLGFPLITAVQLAEAVEVAFKIIPPRCRSCSSSGGANRPPKHRHLKLVS